MQNSNVNSLVDVNYKQYLISVDDVLKIDVFSQEIELSLEFNRNRQNVNQTKETMLFNGYQVNSEGLIDFPGVGKLKVEGLTVSQVSEIIFDRLVKKGLLNNPSVDVKVLNTFFTILGEVNNPGKYDYFQNNMDILQAIGMAGGLTINGERKNIRIIRNIGDKRELFLVDLTSSNFFNSESFQIFSGDVIIINPNNSRIKNAGIIGNSGTLVSLLSFLLSSIILITN
tara:strand:+ start:2688 stop:3368 length:681 start_codon:yes stop_codon:yes gene_type:complete